MLVKIDPEVFRVELEKIAGCEGNPPKISVTDAVMALWKNSEKVIEKAEPTLTYVGTYDTSEGVYPSYDHIDVLKGYMWRAEATGAIQGRPIFQGNSLTAKIDNPGQAHNNWKISAE